MSSDSFIAFVAERFPELWLRTGEHFILTGCSSGTAILMGIPLGIFLFKKKTLRNPAMSAIGIVQTIPSLAMLAFLLAMLHRIGFLPAIIALTLYALLPIVRNTLTGLEGVSPELIEAAKGIGMSDAQQLRMVRIPLATPVIVAGIRTAAVVGVGIATLSAFIGAGGLGQFINRGLALSNTRLILLGAVPAALLALFIDASIGALLWGLAPERKQKRDGSFYAIMRPAALMMPVLLVLGGLGVYFSAPNARTRDAVSTRQTGTVVVGTKNFTEQLILGELMSQLIENRTSLNVERRFNLGGTMICHGAILNGEIDLYAEYTGTGVTAILKEPVISNPAAALHRVREAYRGQFGIEWLEPFGFNNTYSITVRKDQAKKYGWNSISDLIKDQNWIRAGFTAEFAERSDGYPGLSKTYGLRFNEIKDMEPSMMYKAVADGEVDAICAFTTDGRIASYGLKPLYDDRGFFPPYHAVPVVRKRCLDDNAELSEVLSSLKGVLNDETMQQLNVQVDEKGFTPAEVAMDFLKSEGLI